MAEQNINAKTAGAGNATRSGAPVIKTPQNNGQGGTEQEREYLGELRPQGSLAEYLKANNLRIMSNTKLSPAGNPTLVFQHKESSEITGIVISQSLGRVAEEKLAKLSEGRYTLTKEFVNMIQINERDIFAEDGKTVVPSLIATSGAMFLDLEDFA